MTPLKALALQHLIEIQEMNKTLKNLQFGDKVTAAMMFTYCDGTQEIIATETVTLDDLKQLKNE